MQLETGTPDGAPWSVRREGLSKVSDVSVAALSNNPVLRRPEPRPTRGCRASQRQRKSRAGRGDPTRPCERPRRSGKRRPRGGARRDGRPLAVRRVRGRATRGGRPGHGDHASGDETTRRNARGRDAGRASTHDDRRTRARVPRRPRGRMPGRRNNNRWRRIDASRKG